MTSKRLHTGDCSSAGAWPFERNIVNKAELVIAPLQRITGAWLEGYPGWLPRTKQAMEAGAYVGECG